MDDMIYNQTKIPKEQWRYGFRSSADTGCGWIAVYNALRLMGYRVAPEKLIRYFEWQLPLLHGNTGTSIWGPGLYFKRWGFPVKMSARREMFNDLVKESDVSILYYGWRQGWRMGFHFVALRWDGENFVGYNTYRGSEGPDLYGPDLDVFLRQKGYYFPVMTAVRRRGIATIVTH